MNIDKIQTPSYLAILAVFVFATNVQAQICDRVPGKAFCEMVINGTDKFTVRGSAVITRARPLFASGRLIINVDGVICIRSTRDLWLSRRANISGKCHLELAAGHHKITVTANTKNAVAEAPDLMVWPTH